MSGGTLPGYLLRETVTIEPYTGIGTSGPTYGAAVTVRAHVQESRKVPRPTTASVEIAPAVNLQRAYQVWLRLGLDIPPASRVTVRDLTTVATKIDVNDGRGLPVPSHIEMTCEQANLLATTTITIHRGTPTVDAYGDLVDSITIVATAVPAAISENHQTRSAPVDQRGGVVETCTIRLATTPVCEGDRITDDRTGAVYQVTDVTNPHPAVDLALGADDIAVTARRVAATSVPIL